MSGWLHCFPVMRSLEPQWLLALQSWSHAPAIESRADFDTLHPLSRSRTSITTLPAMSIIITWNLSTRWPIRFTERPKAIHACFAGSVVSQYSMPHLRNSQRDHIAFFQSWFVKAFKISLRVRKIARRSLVTFIDINVIRSVAHQQAMVDPMISKKTVGMWISLLLWGAEIMFRPALSLLSWQQLTLLHGKVGHKLTLYPAQVQLMPRLTSNRSCCPANRLYTHHTPNQASNLGQMDLKNWKWVFEEKLVT